MPKTILVIDDDDDIRLMLSKLFGGQGYEIIVAANGEEGIKKYLERMPDLVITDLIMPQKEGIETIRDLKKLNPDVKIIAMSGGGSIAPEEYLSISKLMGANKTFVKPFRLDEIVDAVKELI